MPDRGTSTCIYHRSRARRGAGREGEAQEGAPRPAGAAAGRSRDTVRSSPGATCALQAALGGLAEPRDGPTRWSRSRAKIMIVMRSAFVPSPIKTRLRKRVQCHVDPLRNTRLYPRGITSWISLSQKCPPISIGAWVIKIQPYITPRPDDPGR